VWRKRPAILRPARRRPLPAPHRHGANGQGVPPNPALAGRTEDEMLQAMQDYKSGKRNNAVMKGTMAGLSGQDMANLAAYYASLKK
jgi:cytochrome c553